MNGAQQGANIYNSTDWTLSVQLFSFPAFFLATYLIIGLMCGSLLTTALRLAATRSETVAQKYEQTPWYKWMRLWLMSEFLWPLMIVVFAAMRKIEKR